MIDDDAADDDDDLALVGWAEKLRAEQPLAEPPSSEVPSATPPKRKGRPDGEAGILEDLLLEIADEKDRLRAAGEVELSYDRPVTRADCAPWLRPKDGAQNHARPCPWATCRHHLALNVSVHTGAIEAIHPGVEIWEMVETCSLDIAERGGEPGSGLGHEHTLEEVGEVFNVTRERIRQLEGKAAARIKRGRGASKLLLQQARDEGLLDAPRTKRRLPIVDETAEGEDELTDEKS